MTSVSSKARNHSYIFALIFLFLTPIGLLGYKLGVLNYPLSSLIPAQSYLVDLGIDMQGHGGNINTQTFLPKSDSRQEITQELSSSDIFNFSQQSDALNRIANWDADNVKGAHHLSFQFNVHASHIQYEIPNTLKIPHQYSKNLDQYLQEAEGIQINDPLIADTIKTLNIQKSDPIRQTLFKIHRFLQDELKNKTFAGFTDALTALKLGEASCNGKGRLFVALARKLNIPARLVGGLIMQSGSKKVTHQWVEVYVNGHWVPFDTINDHFAALPENFLTLYYGDEVLFKHSANINFNYSFNIKKRLEPKAELRDRSDDSLINFTNLYQLFEQIGISQNLLKILLMIPFGALVTVFCRNVLGIETFGTFLPALIAAASRETGLWWGAVGFTTIIFASYLIRRVLDYFQLLHSPKMAIMLTMVVIMMLALTVLGVSAGYYELAHISLFPIAILAITAERFSIIEIEQGLPKALKLTFSSIFVIMACYFVMDSLFLHSAVLAFPEILLLVIGVNLWLGKWVGLRVIEYIRFRHLIVKEPSA